MQWQYAEAYLYNHGMEWAVYLLFVAVQIVAGGHGAYQFTARGGFVTDDPLLRWTLPLARASGRLVTVNCALLLVTACKYTWTLIRTYIAPLLPIGFPIDNIMPKYHRIMPPNPSSWNHTSVSGRMGMASRRPNYSSREYYWR